jgi:ParB family chromosome partitioning protein
MDGETGGRLQLIPTAKIIPNPHQPRKVFEEEALEELMTSIKVHGVIPVSYTHLTLPTN